jgi:hypothetical protein
VVLLIKDESAPRNRTTILASIRPLPLPITSTRASGKVYNSIVLSTSLGQRRDRNTAPTYIRNNFTSRPTFLMIFNVKNAVLIGLLEY